MLKSAFKKQMTQDLMELNINQTIAKAIAADVCRDMSKQGLYYHGINHPIDMFNFATKNNIKLNIEQKIAIWFHDKIVNPLYGKFNEKISALYMEACLLQHVDSTFIANVKRHILATECHTLNEEQLFKMDFHQDSLTIMDLDLHSFTNQKTFNFNKKLLIKEYKAFKIKDYKINMINFYKKLDEREFVFRTQEFRWGFNSNAKSILKNELNNAE
jgi:predicted metal-dependent HD superfamily phosphohydrolase